MNVAGDAGNAGVQADTLRSYKFNFDNSDPAADIPALADDVVSGRLDLASLVTDRVGLDGVPEARPYLLPVDFGGTREAIEANVAMRKAALCCNPPSATAASKVCCRWLR